MALESQQSDVLIIASESVLKCLHAYLMEKEEKVKVLAI